MKDAPDEPCSDRSGVVSVACVTDRFRSVMSSVPAPVAVVTASNGGERPVGATVTAFASLSMTPPMMLVALGRESGTLRRITESGLFGINLLHTGQVDIANRFATNLAAKFADTDWTLSSGVPRIAGAPGWVACEVSSIIAGGDHSVVIGAVIDAIDQPADRLIYHRRGYQRATDLG